MPVKFMIPIAPHFKDPRIACKDEDGDIFYPLTYRASSSAPAVAICERCPLQKECAAWAIKVREPEGIWGGLTPDQRALYRR